MTQSSLLIQLVCLVRCVNVQLVLFFFHRVVSSFRAAPTRRTAPSCNNQTVPHLLWPTEEKHFLPLGSLSYYFFFFYMTSSYFVFTLIWGFDFCFGGGFFSGRGHRILFIFNFFFLYIQVMLLHVCRANAYIVSCSSCTYTHTLHTHTHTIHTRRHKELHWPVLVLRSELGFHI